MGYTENERRPETIPGVVNVHLDHDDTKRLHAGEVVEIPNGRYTLAIALNEDARVPSKDEMEDVDE